MNSTLMVVIFQINKIVGIFFVFFCNKAYSIYSSLYKAWSVDRLWPRLGSQTPGCQFLKEITVHRCVMFLPTLLRYFLTIQVTYQPILTRGWCSLPR